MKEFRKTINDLFICEECNMSFKTKLELSNHIVQNHMSRKEYHDKWIKEAGEGFCKICGKETKFWSFNYGYKNCCSDKCTKSLRCKSYKNTCIKRYNQENFNNHNKTEQTLLKIHGIKNAYQLPKSKETLFKNYGVDNPSKSEIVKKRKEETFLKNYYDNIKLKDNQFTKSQRCSFKIKKFKDTNIWYQSSYELDFLEKYYTKYEIRRGPVIKYKIDNKTHNYFPDFYIPSLNLIIEIKSSYLFKCQESVIKEKEKATIANGFKYLIILDRDYTNFMN